ncbi:hypothetical protein AVEN_218601-1 [Araneus ventricosus]|uniref:Uncharacterized protein n=1 Tax=Araneus ventricosus TaxID=182803 RepID=A0A4Y2P592_ARAVE|nr:hypothetical protein AVEN_6660-1 [Araneus ventricosus]GBN46246.1 hypothetical protein AVEN_70813-1 [Araneus ventricosus]GBN46280.1 hypothetical protein AVEN_211388-1 [Araneus ventricosus]GBN46285.1 hypothetical protein AVEN_218601-1 [Araneus ventricosus]
MLAKNFFAYCHGCRALKIFVVGCMWPSGQEFDTHVLEQKESTFAFRIANRISIIIYSQSKLFGCILSYGHEKNPRHQTCRWRTLWKRDIPLHFRGEEKGFISFGEDRIGGSLISLRTSIENEFLA